MTQQSSSCNNKRSFNYPTNFFNRIFCLNYFEIRNVTFTIRCCKNLLRPLLRICACCREKENSHGEHPSKPSVPVPAHLRPPPEADQPLAESVVPRARRCRWLLVCLPRRGSGWGWRKCPRGAGVRRVCVRVSNERRHSADLSHIANGFSSTNVTLFSTWRKTFCNLFP